VLGVKKILVGMSALAAIVLLAACSGSPSGGGDLSLAAVTSSTTTAPPPQVPTTSSQPPASQPSSSQPPSPSSVTSKPAPSKTSAKPVVAAQPGPGVPCAATAKACVDISAHKAWLLDGGGKVIYGPAPMLPGRKGYPTPTGTFHVLSKEKMHLSKEFDNAPMPNSVFFYPGDAFHTGSLSVYSHGCIHLSAAASLRFFNTLKVGDVVQVVP
jgi:hypothetical protein